MAAALVVRPVGTPRGARPAWRVIEQSGDGEADEPGGGRFAVYRGQTRIAWGLRNREAAARWIIRLGGTPPASPLDGVDAAAQAYDGERGPWWSEKD
jgi:hypothetical protein